jgi:hypothetical protein
MINMGACGTAVDLRWPAAPPHPSHPSPEELRGTGYLNRATASVFCSFLATMTPYSETAYISMLRPNYQTDLCKVEGKQRLL